MQALESLATNGKNADRSSFNHKRRNIHNDDSGRPQKVRRLAEQTLASSSVLAEDLAQDNCAELHNQLPSPSLSKACCDLIQSSEDILPRKRKARSLDFPPCTPQSTKKARLHSEPVQTVSPIEQWLSGLPSSEGFTRLDNMSLPPPKRSRSSDSLSRVLSQSGDGTDTTISRDRKYSAYRDINYAVVLETKGSFMRPSDAGLVPEDVKLCAELLSTGQPKPDNVLFHEHFEQFHALLRGRSESRIYLDLHPLLVPSAENHCIEGRKEFQGLVEGHNDLWVKAVPFYGPRPQPDHTFGFKWSNFTELQRRKLGIEPSERSYYTAREDIYFPFLTSEVKCGKQGLDLADRPNAHSMTIALRGIVDLFRKANRAADVHRRALGFSISHDDRTARIFAHYPEIDGEQTTFWRETIQEVNIGDKPWISHQFTLNVCQIFAPRLLARLRTVIDQLPDPAIQAFEPVTIDNLSVMSSQEDSSAPDSQDEGLKKPRKPVGLNVELRNMIQNLQRQLEQQRSDAEQQRRDLLSQMERQLEQQRKDTEQQRRDAEQQRRDAEQQRRDTEQQRRDLLIQLEQQRKDSEQQRIELMRILKEQSEQIKELTRKPWEI